MRSQKVGDRLRADFVSLLNSAIAGSLDKAANFQLQRLVKQLRTGEQQPTTSAARPGGGQPTSIPKDAHPLNMYGETGKVN